MRKGNTQPPAVGAAMRRAQAADISAVDADAGTLRLSFSSAVPVVREWGIEVLSHAPDAVVMDRLRSGAPLLVNHDHGDLVGVVVDAAVEDNRGVATVQFGRSARAQEILRDVVDGIRRGVSVGYVIHEMRRAPRAEGQRGPDRYDVTRWEPLEISLVAVPADYSVGVGRDWADEAANLEDVKMEQTPSPQPAPAVPAPDYAAARAEAVRAERERVQAIRLAGQRMHARPDAIDAAIAEGATLAEFVQRVAAEPALVQTVEAPSLGLGQRDVQQFELRRIILAAATPNDPAMQRDAGHELEVTRAYAEKLGRPGRICIPPEVLARPIAGTRAEAAWIVGQLQQQRDILAGTPLSAGNLIATSIMDDAFAAVLRSRLVTAELGATLLTGLTGNVAIPRQTVGAIGQWVNEGAALPETDQQVVQVPLTPRTVVAGTDFSRKLLLQSSVPIEGMLRLDLTLGITGAVDAAALAGSGTAPVPRGIINTPDTALVAIGTNGGPLTYARAVEMYTAVANANADFGSLGWAVNPNIRQRLMVTGILDATASGRPVWSDNNTVLGFPARVTTALPNNLTKGSGSNLSALIFGNFAELYIGMWGGLELVVNPYFHGNGQIIRITAVQEADIALRRPQAFARCVDAN